MQRLSTADQAAVDGETCCLTEPRTAPDEIARILDRPPVLAKEILRCDTRLTERWAHGALHSSVPGMKGHVIMTYYGQEQDIVWRTGGQRIASRTKPGTITLIPDGHDGRWDIAGPIEVSHVYLTEERLQSCADQLAGARRVELIGRVGFEDPAAARILDLLGREASHGDPASHLFIEQAIDLLCTQLVRGHSSFAAFAAPPAPQGLAAWQVKRVTEYMRDHLDGAIGLSELAGLVNLSRFHFCTAFRQATGITPHGWLVGQRIRRARELLADPALTVTEVALAVGYGTPSAFTASFRRLVGATPSDFRRRL